MRLFWKDNKNNNSTQKVKKNIFVGKKFRNKLTEDYSQYSEQQLFMQLKSENWNKKADEDKIAVLQEIENREATAHDRPTTKVVQAHGSSYGGYIGSTHIIEIRLTDNQFEDLDTLFHESEHANQNKSPLTSVSFSKNDKKLMQIEDMTSSDGISSHYNKYVASLYKVMTSELDANNVALVKVSSLKNEYKNEEKYQEYLVGRQEYYDGLIDAIDIKSSEKKDALLNTVECAFDCNQISENEYSELQVLIANTEDYDSCEKRAIEIYDTLNQVELQDKSDITSVSLDRISSINDMQTDDLTTRQTGIPRYQVVNAAQIQNINNMCDNFWYHHGNTKEDYIELASKLPEIQKEFENGKTYSEIKDNLELQDTLIAYYSDDKMIQVTQDQNGNYQYQDDGRHRVMAAQELGCHIPVNVVNSEEPIIANYYENQKSISDDIMVMDDNKEEKWTSQQHSPMDELSAYMREHNYGRDDFAEYSQDSMWRELHTAAYPDYELPPFNDSRENIHSIEKETAEEISNEKAKQTEDIITEKSEDLDSVMLENKNSDYEENSVMIKDLDYSESTVEIENISEMVEDLDKTDDMDNSVSEAADNFASNDGEISCDGVIDME